MITIWTIYLLAATAASGIFVAAGWRSRRTEGSAAVVGWDGLPADPLWADAEIDIDAPGRRADVGAAIRLAMKRLAPVMVRQSVQAEIAFPSGLLVRMKSADLVDLLEEMLAAAIHSAPASRILMTAVTFGDRVDVGITDDMPGADRTVRQTSVRSLSTLVAMRGGALDINVRPSEGTTMTLRLAAATEEPLAAV